MSVSFWDKNGCLKVLSLPVSRGFGEILFFSSYEETIAAHYISTFLKWSESPILLLPIGKKKQTKKKKNYQFIVRIK